MNRFAALTVLGVAMGLAGCADIAAPQSGPPPSGPMTSSYAYPVDTGEGFGRYGYHSGPYDDTGNGPGETGMEGGGG